MESLLTALAVKRVLNREITYPQLYFQFFANDLVHEINSLDLGVNIADEKLSILLYADDIAWIAETPEELQCMLNKLDNWCRRWRVLINTENQNAYIFEKPEQKKQSLNLLLEQINWK
jgi:hypothetical protein